MRVRSVCEWDQSLFVEGNRRPVRDRPSPHANPECPRRRNHRQAGPVSSLGEFLEEFRVAGRLTGVESSRRAVSG